MKHIFKRTTISDFIITISITLTIITIGLTTINYYSSIERNKGEFNEKVNNTIENISTIIRDPLWNMDIKEIKRIPQLYFQDKDIVSITIDYRLDRYTLSKKVSSPSMLSKMRKEIVYLNEKVGDIEIIFTEENYLNRVWENYIDSVIVFVISLFAVVILLRFLAKFSIEYPFKDLVFNLDQVAKGKYNQRLPKKKHTDIDQIVTKFNSMTKQIEKRDETIKNSMIYLSDIIDSMESGVVTTDSEGGIVLVNRLAKKYFEQLNDQCEGVKFWEQVPQFELFHKTWDEVINFSVEKSLKKSKLFNDITRYFNISIFPLSSEKQKGTVIRIEEVTESVKNEEQLRQAQKMETIGFLAGGLAHDFNNVLGGIIGTVSLIKFNFSKSNYDIEKLTKHIETIEESGQRASDMVKQLLTLSKKHELSLNKMNLNESIKHVVKICNNTFDKSIEINVKYHTTSAYVLADATQIEQVLLNICVNSSHAMTIMRKDLKDIGGLLDISIKPVEFKHYHSKFDTEHRVGEFWNIKIEDSGVGIPKSIMDKVFDPFFTTKDKDKGTGLGLSMVYNIIKQHDGFVDIYSDQDIGTTFNIFLPRKELDNSEIEKTSDQYQVFDGSGTILVIDDEEIMRNLASTILEEMGYNVITAVNGKDGLNKFRSSPVKIKGVLLDMAMPIMSGKETFIHLKDFDPDIKVVMASGFKQDVRVKDSLQLGVLGFIDKPYNISQLSRIAKKYFED